MSTAAAIISVVRDLLQDTDATAYRWTDAELLRYLSAGQRQVCFFRPDANTIEVIHTVSDSNPRRTIPADGFKFIKVVCNIDTGGNRSSRVQNIQQDVLDSIEPNWRGLAATAPDSNNYYSAYVFDPRDRLAFWLYPKPTSGRNVYILYAQTPGEVATTATNLTLTSDFDNALIEFVMYRALQKEGRYARPSDHSNAHYDNFLRALGLNATAYAGLVTPEHQIEDLSPRGGGNG
jgi:hypothetical protein